MYGNFPEVDTLVSEIKNNTNFLRRLLFPRITIIVAIGIVFVVIAVSILH